MKIVTVDNWGQPWDCPKTQYVTLSFNLNRDCPRAVPILLETLRFVLFLFGAIPVALE